MARLIPNDDERMVVKRNSEGVFVMTYYNNARQAYTSVFLSTQEALDLRDGLDKIINEDVNHVARIKKS